MADMNASIKNTTDSNLQKILYRLRDERRVQELLSSRKWDEADRDENGNLLPDQDLSISTEEVFTIGTVSAAIKYATSKELSYMLRRLEQEERLRQILRNMVRISRKKENTTGEEMAEYRPIRIDLNQPVSEIYHYGVLGMKWGVRKDRQSQTQYSKQDRKMDRKLLTRGDIKKIAKLIDSGETYKKARSEIKKARLSIVLKQSRIKNRAKGYTDDDILKDHIELGGYGVSRINSLMNKGTKYDSAHTTAFNEMMAMYMYMSDDDSDILEHFGIKGMKWGVRRAVGPDGRVSSKGTTRSDISKLSDKELRTKINRLQMEKQYSQLTSGQKSKGKKIVNQILGEVGKEIAKEVLRETIKVGTDPAKDAAKKKVESAINAAIKAAKKG